MKNRLHLALVGVVLTVASTYAQIHKTLPSVPVSAIEASSSLPEISAAIQRQCGTPIPNEKWDNWFNEQVELFKANLKTGKTQATPYRIPIIVHVIHGGEAIGVYPNISAAQINSQIRVLNADFAGTGLSVGNYASTGFSSSVPIANCDISFCAATIDPNGNPLAEPGIERISYISKGWTDPASNSLNSSASFQNYVNTTMKPGSIWDPNRYLNIWISDVNPTVGLLGFATFPANTGLSGINSFTGTASTDGVWNWSKAYGDIGTLSAPYNRGRTATHEIGHWLGLRHIWGDGNCVTDFCNDTPPASGQNLNCPTYPNRANSCGGQNPLGEMFMNFMDYTDDVCMYMFTNDQKARMQTAMQLGQFRANLQNNVNTVCGSSGPASCSTLTAVAPTHSLNAFIASPDVNTAGCSSKAGYIYGTNCYGDKEKAEFFPGSLYGNTAGQLKEATVLFFQTNTVGTFGNAATPVNIKVYQGNGSSAPGSLIGSASVSMGVLNAAPIYSTNAYCGNPNIVYSEKIILPYTYTFSPALNVPAGGFYLSVEIPSSNGDTVVVLNNTSTSANSVWEKMANNTWITMSSSWGASLGNKGMGLLPVVCTGVIGLNENISVNDQFIVKPNPSNGVFTIQALSGRYNESTPIKVVNLLGQLVVEKKMSLLVGNETTIDLNDQPNGVYLLMLGNGQSMFTKKIIVQH